MVLNDLMRRAPQPRNVLGPAIYERLRCVSYRFEVLYQSGSGWEMGIRARGKGRRLRGRRLARKRVLSRPFAAIEEAVDEEGKSDQDQEPADAEPLLWLARREGEHQHQAEPDTHEGNAGTSLALGPAVMALEHERAQLRVVVPISIGAA
jgi:hypothetical protein